MFNAKIMVVGDFMWDFYHEACAKALEENGCEVIRFGWFDFFFKKKQGFPEPFYKSFFHRVQYRLNLGPIVNFVNSLLLKNIQKNEPDIIFFHMATIINPQTIKLIRLKYPKILTLQYTHDNPFSTHAKSTLWNKFLKSISVVEVCIAHRKSDYQGYYKYGGNPVFSMRSYFIPDIEYPIPNENIPNSFKCDVVFAGHYEDDGRVEMLEEIIENGYHLNLFGGGWEKAKRKLRTNSPLLSLYPIAPAVGENYRYAINGAKVALCFLSTLNQDTYTTRNFQIPAMRVAMLSQYTDDLANLFIENKEVVFFRNNVELINNLKKLLIDDSFRHSIAANGFLKVYSSGHDIKSRMRDFLKELENYKSNKYD